MYKVKGMIEERGERFCLNLLKEYSIRERKSNEIIRCIT